ncbi:YafY family protein [Pseudomonas sp. RIT-PI-AD]|uniref:helix-turn-helix transcriptional regulator n=1 Tax=Pseudomonas sp. RIT-PI-AD TaxID=3035294 RepID=UPI0021D9E67A|nr:YafY family protein [Pseudomonas sp. RIT-PI-AD]
MSRAQRLLDLLQILRRHRYPITGAALAAQSGISLRTLYRDIATLQAQGAPIEGEPGLGYVLRAGFVLPPLMFSDEEIEALVLGSRWVVRRGDPRLAAAAEDALAKIAAVLPERLRDTLDAGLLVGPGQPVLEGDVDLPTLRRAIRQERKLDIRYRDQRETSSSRRVWPFALGYFEQVRMLVAWCELRQGFRHFRLDRIEHMTLCEQRYPRNRQSLIEAWRQSQGIGEPRPHGKAPTSGAADEN